ncbi:E3 ubiquitin-protein ligase TRIM47-like [Coregonus clupeaformis]|uniref:E3 ubiquitin-protein ligase TRIM47-like n=1 Tax=Coregonus clupeaformis TaxID=59861 RepID=UPI001BE0B935|nr:E3 ubiquitin-protein ligase TRIM47-like [Coregonus clupeaformis]
MAASSSLLSKEHFLCSICLDVFTEPVAIPCGHNFCMACIKEYWDTSDQCRCPMCMDKFDRKPERRINTLFSEMATQFRKSVQGKSTNLDQGPHPRPSPDQGPAQPLEVSCDICAGTTLKALKSCLVCQTSFCETPLEPQRVAALKRHKLINPVENLEDRMHQKHERLLDLFCRSDQTCLCFLLENRPHDTVMTLSL